MVLPVIQHRLTKVGHLNRRRFIKCAFVFSTFACTANITSISTNKWLYTSEVLKYYIFPNASQFDPYEDSSTPITYFKNATIGPWEFCWLDPITDFHCSKVDFFLTEDPSDLTTSVEQSVRYSYIFMVLGCAFDMFGFLSVVLCCLRANPYGTLFFSTVTHIISGLTNFMCVLEFMAAVSEEVGNKVYPASEMDDPIFRYTYGHSLVLLKVSFICTETAAIFLVVVYMSKRDERMFNRYQISTLLKSVRDDQNDGFLGSAISNDRYHQHARITRLRKASRYTIQPTHGQCCNLPNPVYIRASSASETLRNPSLDGSLQGVFTARPSPLSMTPQRPLIFAKVGRTPSTLSITPNKCRNAQSSATRSRNCSDASDGSGGGEAYVVTRRRQTLHPFLFNVMANSYPDSAKSTDSPLSNGYI